ncbi:transcription repressor OFP6-like [Benincasa hispida]|uniref:transcription repressor OFP6-like n=1 Tax=Benincasa hispida TaxID=102211 RepID=UPI0019017455|nr:transcription repressor OFP6-like [Benincasa hispida]
MSNRKKKFTSIFSSTSGCGGCRKPKLSDVVEPNKKPTTTSFRRSSSTSSNDRNGGLSLDDEDCSSTTKSTTGIQSPVTIRIGDDSIAVEKDSDNPYEDFCRSMVQMIVEKRIYSPNGLQELLNCFLHLNSPYHHEIILKAFTHISNEFEYHRLWNISNNTDRKPPSAGEG